MSATRSKRGYRLIPEHVVERRRIESYRLVIRELCEDIHKDEQQVKMRMEMVETLRRWADEPASLPAPPHSEGKG
jgi:hypothetical protein